MNTADDKLSFELDVSRRFAIAALSSASASDQKCLYSGGETPKLTWQFETAEVEQQELGSHFTLLGVRSGVDIDEEIQGSRESDSVAFRWSCFPVKIDR